MEKSDSLLVLIHDQLFERLVKRLGEEEMELLAMLSFFDLALTRPWLVPVGEVDAAIIRARALVGDPSRR